MPRQKADAADVARPPQSPSDASGAPGFRRRSARLNRRRKKIGVVASDKMQKTIVVRVGHKFREPALGKVVERFVKFKAHDEENQAKTGDTVEIEETRPISREKRWRLLRVLQKAGDRETETVPV